MYFIYNAVTGKILRYGDDPNPLAQKGPGEEVKVGAPPAGDVYSYKINISTFEFEELPPITPVITWVEIRIERDRLLANSDWTVLPDTPLNEVDLADAIEYRTALRDITDNFLTPEEVEWPVKPSFIP